MKRHTVYMKSHNASQPDWMRLEGKYEQQYHVSNVSSYSEVLPIISPNNTAGMNAGVEIANNSG